MEKIKQGAIINNIYSELYEDLNCSGIVVTANCDIAQKKVKKIHYITLITLEDWLLNEGIYIITKDYLKTIIGDLKKWMSDNDYEPEYIYDLGPKKLQILVEKTENNNKKKNSILNKIEDWIDVNKIEDNKIANSDYEKYIKNMLNEKYSKHKKEKLKLIIENKISGYYYIPNNELSLGSELLGYIVNLRDIQSIDIKTAELLEHNKIDLLDNKELLKMEPDLWRNFKLNDKNQFAIIVSYLDSPRIEHLMQHFSLMFTRIGLTDINEKYRTEVLEHNFQ